MKVRPNLDFVILIAGLSGIAVGCGADGRVVSAMMGAKNRADTSSKRPSGEFSQEKMFMNSYRRFGYRGAVGLLLLVAIGCESPAPPPPPPPEVTVAVPEALRVAALHGRDKVVREGLAGQVEATGLGLPGPERCKEPTGKMQQGVHTTSLSIHPIQPLRKLRESSNTNTSTIRIRKPYWETLA